MPAASTTPTVVYPPERLHEFSRRVFLHFDVPEEEATLAADVLARSDLRGIDSHGVARLRTYYDMLDHGRINPRPQLRIVRESASTATVDGDNGLGLVVGPKANRIAMDKAEEAGSGWVSVCNTNHYGIAGYYVLEALARGQIGWSMTNTTSLVAPLWGAERMLGTNPIAIGFPADEEPDIVIDMATCAAAYGKVEIAKRRREPLPEGWAIDAEGVETVDPDAMIEGGALLPLGSRREQGGHKGYCLAVMVDVLSCVLSGANWGPFAPPFALRQTIPSRSVGRGIGHFFGAMRIDAFIDPDAFRSQIDDYVRTLRATRPAPGHEGPLVPGDPEREAEQLRSASGVPLVLPVVEDLRAISAVAGIPFD
jgi:LDH2 family malate/lactate/ureidoglycolate dehydrogenase